LKVAPKFSRVYEMRGSSYYNIGFYRQAVADWRIAVDREPSLYEKLKVLILDASEKSGVGF